MKNEEQKRLFKLPPPTDDISSSYQNVSWGFLYVCALPLLYTTHATKKGVWKAPFAHTKKVVPNTY